MSDFKTYLLSYPYKGERWVIEIKAESFEDAEARLKALGWAKLDGEAIIRIPVAPRPGFWRRLLRLAPAGVTEDEAP